MNIFSTYTPTTIGMMIISVLFFAGVIGVSSILRPIERALAKNRQQALSKTQIAPQHSPVIATVRNTKPKTVFGEQPYAEHAHPTFTSPSSWSDEGFANIDNHWGRIADHLDNEIDRIKKASVDHCNAKTQLLAAEFSLSELFREFPNARDTFNPVTYIEFPGLKSRKSRDEIDRADNSKTIASA